MRISKLKTTVAALRNKLEMKTPEFANLVGLSLSAVEKLETGRLKLSTDVAMKISVETGVSEWWLKLGDPAVPPHDQNGRPFTEDTFNATRETVEQWGVATPDIENCFLDWLVLWQAMGMKAIATSASANGKLPLFMRTVGLFIEELESKFGFPEKFDSKAINELAEKRGEDLCLLSIGRNDPATSSRLQYLLNFTKPAQEKNAWFHKVVEEKNRVAKKSGKPSRQIKKKK